MKELFRVVSRKTTRKALQSVDIVDEKVVLAVIISSYANQVREKLMACGDFIKYEGELDQLLLPFVLEAFTSENFTDVTSKLLTAAAATSCIAETCILFSSRELSKRITTDVLQKTFAYSALIGGETTKSAVKSDLESEKGTEQIKLALFKESSWDVLGRFAQAPTSFLNPSDLNSKVESIYDVLFKSARKGRGVSLSWSQRVDRLNKMNGLIALTDACSYEALSAMSVDEQLKWFTGLSSLDIYIQEVNQYSTKWPTDLYYPTSAGMMTSFYMSARQYTQTFVRMAVQALMLKMAVSKAEYDDEKDLFDMMSPIIEDVIMEKVVMQSRDAMDFGEVQKYVKLIMDTKECIRASLDVERLLIDTTWMGSKIKDIKDSYTNLADGIDMKKLSNLRYPLLAKSLGQLSSKVSSEFIPWMRMRSNINNSAYLSLESLIRIISLQDIGESRLDVTALEILLMPLRPDVRNWEYKLPMPQSPLTYRIPAFIANEPYSEDPDDPSIMINSDWIFADKLFEAQLGITEIVKLVKEREVSYYYTESHVEFHPLVSDFVRQPIPYCYARDYTRIGLSQSIANWWNIQVGHVPYKTPDSYFRALAETLAVMDQPEREYLAATIAGTLLIQISTNGTDWETVTPGIPYVWGAPTDIYIKKNVASYDKASAQSKNRLAFKLEMPESSAIIKDSKRFGYVRFMLVTKLPGAMTLTPWTAVPLKNTLLPLVVPTTFVGAIGVAFAEESLKQFSLNDKSWTGIIPSPTSLNNEQKVVGTLLKAKSKRSTVTTGKLSDNEMWQNTMGYAQVALVAPHLSVRSNDPVDTVTLKEWDYRQVAKIYISLDTTQEKLVAELMYDANIWTWDVSDWEASASLDAEPGIYALKAGNDPSKIDVSKSSDGIEQREPEGGTPKISNKPILSEQRAADEKASMGLGSADSKQNELAGSPDGDHAAAPDLSHDAPEDGAPRDNEIYIVPANVDQADVKVVSTTRKKHKKDSPIPEGWVELVIARK